MVEEIGNIGLGEAIAGGTRLSGDWGSPVTRGLQMGMQNDFARLQREQQAQARLDKQAQEMAKLSSFDEGKWFNPKRAKEVHEYINSRIPELENASKAKDWMKRNKIESEMKYEVNLKKIVDNDEKALNSTSDRNIIKGQAQKVYNEKGAQGIIDHNDRYFFAPIAQVDPESGSFKLYDVSNPNLDKKITDKVAKQILPLAATKGAGSAGGSNAFELDPANPRYQQEKADIIESIISDDDLVHKIVYTEDFKKHYDKFLNDHKIDPNSSDETVVEEAVEEVAQEVVTETPAEVATEAVTEAPVVAEDEHTPPEDFTPAQKEAFRKAIDKKVWQRKEAERKADAAEQALQEAREKLAKYEAPIRPDIPPVPDPYEDNFAQKAAYRDAMIVRAAQFDYEQQQQAQFNLQRAAQAKAEQEQEQLKTVVTTYSKTAEKMGITAEKLATAGSYVAQFGIPDNLAQHILLDDQGPAVTVYLADNPLELEKLVGMNPLRAAAYIESTIKPNARKAPPPVVPKPVDSVKGSGIAEKERGVPGTVYE